MSVTLASTPSSGPTHRAAQLASGVWSPVLVPVKADSSMDHERFAAHCSWLLEQGCHGLALFGTTSEANSFSVAERMALLESTLDSGLAPAQIMVGTGCCAIPDTVDLSRHAAQLGAKNLLMLPPFYYKNMSDEGLYRAFATAFERIGDGELKVYLYHFPKMSGVPITVGLLEMLEKSFPELIAGVKDSSGDGAHTRDLIERFPNLAIFPGSERLLRAGLEQGGAGCITASGNAHPRAVRAVYDAFESGSRELDVLNDHMVRVRHIIERHPMVPALKALVAFAREDPEWARVRPPMVELDGEATQSLLTDLRREGFTMAM